MIVLFFVLFFYRSLDCIRELSFKKSDFSYKETLNLLKTDFSMRANSVIKEPEIHEFWSKNKIDLE